MITFDEALNLDIEGKNILILGCPASGKTHLANLFDTAHQKFHTDDYIQHGYEQSLYVLLRDVVACPDKTLIEGIQGYRLLRKGVQLDNYYPDMVIELIISEEQMMRTYKGERDEKKIKYLSGVNKSHAKILSDYHAMDNPHKPEWIQVDNKF